MLKADCTAYFNGNNRTRHPSVVKTLKKKKSKPQRQRWERTGKQLRPCRVKHDLFLPARVELDVGIKEADDRSRGRVPAVYPGSDQALPLAVPHNLYQAWVAFVHILVQVEFQLHWKKADWRVRSFNSHPNDSVGTLIRQLLHMMMCFRDNPVLMSNNFSLICLSDYLDRILVDNFYFFYHFSIFFSQV